MSALMPISDYLASEACLNRAKPEGNNETFPPMDLLSPYGSVRKRVILISPTNIGEVCNDASDIELYIDRSITWGNPGLSVFNYHLHSGEYYHDYQDKGTTCKYIEPKDKNFIFTKISQYHGISNERVSNINNDADYHLKIVRLAYNSIQEEFENGVDSDFSRNFTGLVLEGGYNFLKVYFSSRDYFSQECFIYTLRILGRILDNKSLHIRLWFLDRMMKDRASIVRDSASLALAEIGTIECQQYIKKAVDNEKDSSLKEDMQMLLDEWDDA